jgi:hypothetical protein
VTQGSRFRDSLWNIDVHQILYTALRRDVIILQLASLLASLLTWTAPSHTSSAPAGACGDLDSEGCEDMDQVSGPSQALPGSAQAGERQGARPGAMQSWRSPRSTHADALVAPAKSVRQRSLSLVLQILIDMNADDFYSLFEKPPSKARRPHCPGHRSACMLACCELGMLLTPCTWG